MSAPTIQGRPVYRLYQLAWAGLDWLYPPRCGGCSQGRSRWCPTCQQAAHTLPETICQKCGCPLPAPGTCPGCAAAPPALEALRSWAFFSGPVRNALHRLKYSRDIALGEVLSRHMIDFLFRLGWQIDLVCPVPVGVARRAERGYNQATFLALPLALACNKPYRPGALRRLRDTRSQVGLNIVERKANVAGAFEASRRFVSSKRVLLVDDVTTTGATLQECAQALLNSGASQVYGLTLARAA